MKPYTHFTLNERKYLQESLESGDSIRKIAKALRRSPSTISREIKRNWSKNKVLSQEKQSYQRQFRICFCS